MACRLEHFFSISPSTSVTHSSNGVYGSNSVVGEWAGDPPGEGSTGPLANCSVTGVPTLTMHRGSPPQWRRWLESLVSWSGYVLAWSEGLSFLSRVLCGFGLVFHAHRFPSEAGSLLAMQGTCGCLVTAGGVGGRGLFGPVFFVFGLEGKPYKGHPCPQGERWDGSVGVVECSFSPIYILGLLYLTTRTLCTPRLTK